jgi:hydrogenase maturation protease
MKTLLIGLGNPILTDDGVGILVAREVKRQLSSVEFLEASLAGISLLEDIAGYDRVVIIDSIKTGKGALGEMYKLRLEDLGKVAAPSFAHGVGLRTAIELGKRLGYIIPESLEIYAIEVKDNTTFHEGCTSEIETRIPELAQRIVKNLRLEGIEN